jgi:hypothetical protein
MISVYFFLEEVSYGGRGKGEERELIFSFIFRTVPNNDKGKKLLKVSFQMHLVSANKDRTQIISVKKHRNNFVNERLFSLRKLWAACSIF